MRHLLPGLLLLALATAAFAGTPPAPMRDFSRKAALAEAARDLKSGHLKVYLAGGEAFCAPGIDEPDVKLVAKLPRDTSLPAGCAVPHAPEAVGYAEAYNRAIIAYLRAKAK